MRGLEDLIAGVIEDPDIVVKGRHGESIAMRSLETVSGSAKYLVVPYDEGGEVKTALLPRSLKGSCGRKCSGEDRRESRAA